MVHHWERRASEGGPASPHCLRRCSEVSVGPGTGWLRPGHSLLEGHPWGHPLLLLLSAATSCTLLGATSPSYRLNATPLVHNQTLVNSTQYFNLPNVYSFYVATAGSGLP